ncbi:MAG: sigma 54-interacting transcriptional regulator, partial [Pseudomonadota bacterium]
MIWELLIVEDDQAMASLLSNLAKNVGFLPKIAPDIASAHQALSQSTPDILFTDHRLPDGEGVDLLEAVSVQFPELPSVMITGYATVPTVVRAFRAGALDLISKPFDNDEVRRVLKKVSDKLAQRSRIEALQTRLQIADGETAQLVSDSASMSAAINLANRVAELDTPILLTGDTGTGKSLLAHWIHNSSSHNKGPWLSINCGAVAESIAESELFGYERGAFTGANQRKHGLLELAEGGTLFLDEINSASMSIQTRLLEFVQHG